MAGHAVRTRVGGRGPERRLGEPGDARRIDDQGEGVDLVVDRLRERARQRDQARVEGGEARTFGSRQPRARATHRGQAPIEVTAAGRVEQRPLVGPRDRRERGVQRRRVGLRGDERHVPAVDALVRRAVLGRPQGLVEVLEQRMGVVVPTGLLCSQLADALEALGEDDLALAWSQRWIALAPGDHLAAGELLRRAAKVKNAESIDSARRVA